MALIILTTTGGATLTMPGDFQAAGSSVTLFGSGGNGGTGTTGTSGTSGGGGGGGACTVCVYTSGTFNPGTNVPYLCNAGGSANATQWQSATAGSGAYYEALPGGNGAAAGTAGAASGATTTVGTPTITFTPTNHTGAAGGAGGGANTLGGGGGGGSGGPAANGGTGGTPTSTGGGGGGGGGAANAGGSPSTATGGTGGNGSTGAGGTGSGTTGTPGNPGTGSSGGGGGPGAVASSTGGNGGSGTDISRDVNAQIGCGGGGGASGRQTAVGAPTANVGGGGGNYGGGGGGIANSRTGGGTSGGAGAQGAIGIVYRSSAWNFAQEENDARFSPPHLSTRKEKRYAGAKGKSEFAVFPFWRNRGWEEVFSQEPRRKWEKAAAVMPKEDGTEAPFIRFLPTEWHEPPMWRHPRPENFGAVAKGDEGIEQIKIPFTPISWPTDTRSQDKHPRPEKAGGIMRGDDGSEGIATQLPQPPVFWSYDYHDNAYKWRKYHYSAIKHRSEFAFFSPWFNLGWEETFAQPPHRVWKSPDIGDSGIVAPFVPPVTITWGFDPALFQIKVKRPWVFTDNRDDGWSFPLISFFPSGWQQVFSQDRHPIWKSPDVGDQGIQFPFINFIPISWPHEQTWKHVPVQQRGAFLRGDDGNQFPLQGFFPVGWEQVQTQPLHRLFKSPEYGDQGTQFPFQFFFPPGWAQTASQDRHPIWKSPDIGDSGIQSPFIPFIPIAWPHEQTWKHPRSERFGSVVPRDDGIVFPMPPSILPLFETSPPLLYHRLFKSPEYGDQGTQFPFQAFFPSGWQQILSQDKHPAYRTPDVGDSGIQFPLIQFFPYGWPQFGPVDRHPRPERAGAIMLGEPGIELPLPPVFIPWFENTPPPLLHRFWHSPEFGDQGTQFPFQFFYPAGWAQTASQDRHPVWKSPTLGDPLGFDFPLINFFPAGWAQVFSQDKHPVYRSPDIGDTGIEFPFVPPTVFPLGWEQIFAQPVHRFYKSPEFGDQGTQFPLIQFFPYGWEVQPPQPPHRTWKSPDTGDQGIQSPFVRFFPYGWEIQPPQPPHTWVRHRGLWMRGPDAIERPFTFWINVGFDQTASQDRFWPYRRPAALFRGDEGNEAPFVFWRNTGWEPNNPQPPHWPPYPRAAAGMRGDEGNQFPFQRFFPAGWEQIFAQPRLWPTIRQHGLGLRGDEGIIAPFVPPPIISGVTGFDQVFALTRRTLQYRGGAIMPWVPAEVWPITPIPVTPATGDVFVIDTIQSYFLGPRLNVAGFAKGPFVNQASTMIFVVGPGMITSPVLLTFTRPDGSLTTGVVPRGFVGDATITQKYIADFPRFQYIVYTFAPGELNQPGVWHVSAIADHFFSQTWPFTVMQYP